MLYKLYLDTKKENVKVRFNISFNKLTSNWASGRTLNKGYRVHASIVEVSSTLVPGVKSESFDPMEGFSDELLNVERQGKARLQQAIDILLENIPKYKKWFINKGIEFKE